MLYKIFTQKLFLKGKTTQSNIQHHLQLFNVPIMELIWEKLIFSNLFFFVSVSVYANEQSNQIKASCADFTSFTSLQKKIIKSIKADWQVNKMKAREMQRNWEKMVKKWPLHL